MMKPLTPCQQDMLETTQRLIEEKRVGSSRSADRLLYDVAGVKIIRRGSDGRFAVVFVEEATSTVYDDLETAQRAVRLGYRYEVAGLGQLFIKCNDHALAERAARNLLKTGDTAWIDDLLLEERTVVEERRVQDRRTVKLEVDLADDRRDRDRRA